jgi:alpha-tubulin suppressor-like RCC1 family protein
VGSRTWSAAVLALPLGCGGLSRFQEPSGDEGSDSTRTRWVYVAAGGSNTCAIAAGGRLACWGANGTWQVGAHCNRSSANYPMVPVCAQPVWVGGLSLVRQVACAGSGGSGRACAVVEDGSVWCWGTDPGSQHAAAVTTNPSPVRVEGLPASRKISVEGTFACALSTEGAVLCWGRNYSGELGVPADELEGSAAPLRIELPFRAVDVLTGGGHACALLESHSLVCWGRNDDGELGVGLPLPHDGHVVRGQVSIPPSEVDLGGVATAATGRFQACAVSMIGSVSCWGNKSRGRLGLPTELEGYTAPATEVEPLPTRVSAAPAARLVELGETHVCVSDQSDAAWCWGDNLNDQIVDGPSILPPTRIEGATGVGQIAAGDYHTCFLSHAGRLSCSGFASFGELGNGETEPSRGYVVSVLEPVDAAFTAD